MLKNEFLTQLESGLSGHPKEDIVERLEFYREMIDDRMEEGLSEEEAVQATGSVDAVISQIISDTPLTKLVKNKISGKRFLNVWEIVLLAVGSPIWVSLLIAALAVVFSLYVSLWSVIISLWSVFASLAACAVSGVVVGVAFIMGNNAFSGTALVGAGLVCTGLSIFCFYGCKKATKAIVTFTKYTVFRVKRQFVGKEGAQ